MRYTKVLEKLPIEDIEETKILTALDNVKMPQTNGIINAKIKKIGESGVIVSLGLKSEGIIPIEEFSKRSVPKQFALDMEIPVIMTQFNKKNGLHMVSYREAKKQLIGKKLQEYLTKQEIISCDVMSKVRDGYIVDIGVNAFLPSSEINYKALTGMDKLTDETIRVVIIDVPKNKNKMITVSHRKAIEIEKERRKKEVFSRIKEGDIVEGTVTNVTKFGVFVDLNGAEGLVHISELAWYKIDNINEFIKVGDNIKVKVLKVNRDEEKISLSLKQLQVHPWETVEEKYKIGDVVEGKVTSIVDFGAFIQLEPGIDALLHVSEVSWTRCDNIEELFKVGDKIKVKILEINKNEKKISVSFKQLLPNPWEEFKKKYQPGNRVKGVVSRLTPFGAFVKLENNLEGLIHISDFSWVEKIKSPSEKLDEGQEVECVILEVDPNEERINLSLKHLTENPFKKYTIDSIVDCEVIKVESNGATVKLDDNTYGFIPAQEISIEKKHPIEVLTIGEKVQAKVISSDEQKKKIELSIKKLEFEREKELKNIYSQPTEIKIKDIIDKKQ